MEDSEAEQIKVSASIHLSFDQLESVHLSLNHAVAPLESEGCSDGIPVFPQSSNKTLEFRARALEDLLYPPV